MEKDDLYQKLLNSGFRFISYRPRSEKETRNFLEKKLNRRKISNPQTLEKVIERLRELGYIDDAKFGQWWVEQRQAYRPKSLRVVAQELRLKGVDREIIDKLVRNRSSQYENDRRRVDYLSEKDLALRAIQKKTEAWKRLPILECKKKIYDYLGRRGFNRETIFRVIDETLGKGYNTSEDLNEAE